MSYNHILTNDEPLPEQWLVYCAVFASTLSRVEACKQSKLDPRTVEKHDEHPSVKAQIARNIQTICDRATVDAAYVLKALVDMLESDIVQGMTARGDWLPLHQWPEPLRRRVESLEFNSETGELTKVKLTTSLAVIDRLGKHTDVAAFEERQRVTHDIGNALADRLTRARQRSGLTIEGETVSNG